MEINTIKIKNSLQKLQQILKCKNIKSVSVIGKFIEVKVYDEKIIGDVFNYLSEKILDLEYTDSICICFPEFLTLIISSACPIDNENECNNNEFNLYCRRSFVLSKLSRFSKDILRYAVKYFKGKPAPYHVQTRPDIPKKKSKHNDENSVKIDELTIVKTCYNLLTCDRVFFKNLWDWSKFLENYCNNDCALQRIYCNHIIAILMNMTRTQLNELNKSIPEDVKINFDAEINRNLSEEFDKITVNDANQIKDDKIIKWKLPNNILINIEGVMLPIYNKNNAKFYEKTDGSHERIVKVKSTINNLRNIALGISSGKAICLSGPVGCGKTTLVEYLSRKIGRCCPKENEIENYENEIFNQHGVKKKIVKEKSTKVNGIEKNTSNKRKNSNNENGTENLNENYHSLLREKEGFLRIQLGDQTDSKMLLGQYRCTDVPGEFIWLPGVLTQAVMNGYWLLLEDLDCATQEICMILSNLLENNFLSVPGFRDCIKIEPGFQLFFTMRTNQSTGSLNKSTYSLLEKHLYTVNIHPLSKSELCNIISENYPKLTTVANRIVDVFFKFSNKTKSFNADDDEEPMKKDYIELPFSDIENNILTNLPNSGRMVSTRDLMKLCKRSNPMFSVTSSECAYFVFQNAVDVFCSYLPQGKERTKLITAIGAKLGIIQSRCEFYSKEYKPEIKLTSCGNEQSLSEFDNAMKFGRGELKMRQNDSEKSLSVLNDENYFDSNDIHVSKRLRLCDSKEKTIVRKIVKDVSSTFSFTRITSCLLERVAVSIAQNEPILLVGETGVGKTSAVQYIAEQTNHKLCVVNMNNQSDASDLIGGFKPVDLCYIMQPIRFEFEFLFRKTFNEIKNEKFLSNLSICYNQGNFNVLVKLMIRIIETAVCNTDRTNDYLKRWKSLHVKLLKLNTQLRKSINISFAFIPGSLVNCIRNGDWLLLDEINLASAETLECLTTILEPDGSIVLLERGDLTPIKRHPDFRIFACMNPSTDIGKKDLPTGIRNRFTEFFVDELTTENDLMQLVSDYLANTGIQKTKVLNIVRLYKKLKSLAQLDLNDGLGNRPVYSLRTLCRALRICAKNLCGSIDRNLYESFCMSFLTQLDQHSHNVVLRLITESLLGNAIHAKAVLSQPIPKPPSNSGSVEEFYNFEGYWIQKGPKKPDACDYYILTESVQKNLKDLCRIISIGKLPILLQGPTSAGKTSLIEYIAKKSGNYCLRINNHEHTDLQEYIGAYTSDANGKLHFREGILVQAMRNGFWIILDELNLASTEILEALNRVLDDNRELFIPEIQTLVKAHPNFMLFATQNPPGLYGGRKTLSRAFKNRFIELHFNEIPRNELEIILEKRCLIPKSYSHKMVNCMSDLHVNRKTTTIKNTFTLRDLFRWGNRYTYADKTLLENQSYDWNQHLVDEGYLVLSSKCRNDIELEIIEETLHKNFRKRIFTRNLYYLHEATSMVTKKILEVIYQYKQRKDIIWTENMLRMTILTAKALQFNEPVLLVGPTGCGKTTICQILAEINSTSLKILNCHMHTEGADFLGGLRPCRKDSENDGEKLFEWVDGPLVISMRDGTYFMADEISLAEDSVLERLNSVLEPERTILLAEKSDVSSESNLNVDTLSKLSDEFVIQAKNGFQFLATMNPGGDFGKKELSPALRNRFTEIWCKPSDSKEDLIEIAKNFLLIGFKTNSNVNCEKIAEILIDIVFHIKENVDKFKFSVRDILSWADYIIKVSVENAHLKLSEILIMGLETLFLDSLEMIPHENLENIDKIRMNIIVFAVKKIQSGLEIDFDVDDVECKRQILLEKYSNLSTTMENCFFFDAPTTKKNLLRLLSAMNLNKGILLEGPPGVGKTSIVENLCKAIGYKIVRINLCEHTDLADLFGTDLPAEEKTLEINSVANDEQCLSSASNLGKFVWRDGPLLAALKSNNTWILLDELNLAPQNVLEGLNAILDHRGEVFIPELNRTFTLNKHTRIFGCQNPLRQGGGRKGLPQSFLNRFTKVYLRKLTTDDLLFVIKQKYQKTFNQIQNYFEKCLINYEHVSKTVVNLFDFHFDKDKLKPRNLSELELKFDIAEKMVEFSEKLDQGIMKMEFGLKGGPFEINLRDILRWCDLLINQKTGFIIKQINSSKDLTDLEKEYNNFLLILYEKMKLVYHQRMRSENDKIFIRNTFSDVFHCNAEELNEISEDVSLYWTDSKLFFNDIVVERERINDELDISKPYEENTCNSSLILSSQRELIKNMIECVHMEMPVILCGPTDSGKTKAVDILCTIANQNYDTDTIDDSVTGGFQQIDLNRHLEEAANIIQLVYSSIIQKLTIDFMSSKSKEQLNHITDLLNIWKNYSDLSKTTYDPENVTVMSDELNLFRKRIDKLLLVINRLQTFTTYINKQENILENVKKVINQLKNIVKNSDSLNTGGHFEWIDSKFVKCLKYGRYICLEHVNLCSSAVLDRLNSVFEPNGTLLISEKGVTSSSSSTLLDESEIVHKHKNFRAFLTLDSRHGELSRAMRNRCIEIALLKENYTQDDLKMLIYENNIHDNKLINIILAIHQNIKNLSEFNVFTISHLLHCASLVSAYKNIGYDNRKAIYDSAVEVYVNSSNTDLLGYGLEFYRNKMKDVVRQEIDKHLNSVEESKSSLDKVVLKSKNLNTMAMIKLQAEPLCVVLNNYSNHDLVKIQLVELFKAFENLDIKVDESLLKFLIYILYESSTFEDVTLRHEYLRKFISNLSNKDLAGELMHLSDIFVNTIKEESNNNSELPWNQKLFYRLRDYNFMRNSSDDLNLSLQLIFHLIVSRIPTTYKIDKLNKISAIAYSHAVVTHSISDSIHDEFIQQISTFLQSVTKVLPIVLKNLTISNNLSLYIDLITKFLWINRFYECTKNRIFIDKKLNTNLLDRLLLHFKWIEKYFSELMQAKENKNSEEFTNCVRKMRVYVENNRQPLDVYKKLYQKKMINFMPFYTEHQVKLFEIRKKFEDLTRIVPNYGSFDRNVLLKKFNFIFNDEKSQSIKERILLLSQFENLKYIQSIETATACDYITKCLGKTFVELCTALKNEDQKNNSIDLNDIETEIQEIESKDESNEETVYLRSNEITMKMIPILECFAEKTLNCIHMPHEISINTEFFDNLPTLSCNIMELVRIFNIETFEKCIYLYDEIQGKYFRNTNSKCMKNFEDLLNLLSINCYKNLSTFYRLTLNSLQKYRLTNLSFRNDFLQCLKSHQDDDNCNLKSIPEYNGSLLTNSLISFLFQKDGKLRECSLSDIHLWKQNLTRIQEILWNNSYLLRNSLKTSQYDLNLSVILSNKILIEVEYVTNMNTKEQKQVERYQGFKNLIEKLQKEKTTVENVINSINTESGLELGYYSSLLYTLISAIEMSIFTYTPLIDPVEKNNLKNFYNQQDIECINRFKTAYDFMKIVMNYKNFGSEIYSELHKKLKLLEKKQEKYQKKVALRPQNSEHENQTLFSNLVQEIQHFCSVNCDPKQLLEFIENVQKQFEIQQRPIKVSEAESIFTKISDVIKKINLSISNSQKFLFYTLEKYAIYYADFVKPVECAIIMFQYGLEGFKKSLTQLKDSFYKPSGSVVYKNFNENSKLLNVIENIVKFPSTTELEVIPKQTKLTGQLLKTSSTFFTILDNLNMENCEMLYIQLLKAKLIEIKIQLNTFPDFNSIDFHEFDSVLSICNKIWQEDEEKRRKCRAEEENLYSYKTRCETKTEEEQELIDIQEIFPNYVQNDFNEFIVEDTLEKVINVQASGETSKSSINRITEEDYKFFAENFIAIMEQFAGNYYYNPCSLTKSNGKVNLGQKNSDYIDIFKIRSTVFVKLFERYNTCLSEDCLEDKIYNTFALVVGLQQDIVDKSSLTIDSDSPSKSQTSYNFYKDSNVKEILSITDLMDKLEARVKQQLDLYPEHATLNDIITIINRIRNFSFSSPIVRFNTGFQLLRQKVAQWNEVAHKNNHLKDIESEIAEYVQRWTLLELQFWRTCMQQSYQKVESKAYKYWLFIYNLLNEFLYENQIQEIYNDFKKTEKKFDDEEDFSEELSSDKKISNIQVKDIIRILKQFIESSNYADFRIRMKLLKSFELYLHYVNFSENTELEERRENLVAALHNLRVFFEQFAPEIEMTCKSIAQPIEKKLKDFVKIESYNKDLSYFSMKNNIAKVHRNLNKFLKEYETLLREKIIKVFQQNENELTREYAAFSNDDKGINLRHESKVKHYMVDVKQFIAPQKKSITNSTVVLDAKEDQSSLIVKVPKLFTTSRNISKKILEHVNYSNMIFALDSLLTDQIETCEYLRKLEIDRTQERPKQVTQAKQILTQKRKALSDLFKTLLMLGINFKSGLMELTLTTNSETIETPSIEELINYEIQPFDIKTMFGDQKLKRKFDKHLLYINENLNNYYTKCIFKLRLLHNVLLHPQSELGPQNIERIKGFSVDLFVLITNQRKLLSKSTKELHDLRKLICDMNTLENCTSNLNENEMETVDFIKLDAKLDGLQIKFCKLLNVLEQFNLLLDKVPDDLKTENLIVKQKNMSTAKIIFTKTNEKLEQIKGDLKTILKLVQNGVMEITKLKDVQFLSLKSINQLENLCEEVLNKSIDLRNEFKIGEMDYLPIAKPLTDILRNLNDLSLENTNENLTESSEFDNIDTELQNVIHSILMALQKLYKKYENIDENQQKENGTSKETEDKDTENSQEIQENHLKQKICQELNEDLKLLNITNILQKLSNILMSIKYGKMNSKGKIIRKTLSILPLLEQFCLIGNYYLLQQLATHKISTKMLSIMLTVFIELGSKGFCIPPDLMQDEDGESKKNEQQNGEGFGLEDGTGENDVSDKIESEDQLEDAKRPEDRKDESKNQENCKEEKGIDVNEDFDGNLQDIEKPNDDDDESNKDDDENDLDKEMGETEEGAEKLDDQIWGSDEEQENSEDENDEEMNEEDEGKGSKEDDDQHNDLNTKNSTEQGETDKNDDGLDATNDNNAENDKKKQKNDIDNMQEPELDDDQVNPYHNELEDPPEAEEMDLENNGNVDDDDNDNENENGENPFDIDTMKENMMSPEEDDNDNGSDNDEKNDENADDSSDSETEPEAGTKPKDDEKQEENPNEDENGEETSQTKDSEIVEEEKPDEEEQQPEKERQNDDEYNESKDKPTKEDNVQSIPQEKQKGSTDQVQANDKMDVEQDNNEMDEQDTGEEKDGIGQAENDKSETGHQGVTDAKQTQTNKDKQENKDSKEKRKQGKTDEERTLGEAEKNKLKQLKTIEKLKDQKPQGDDEQDDDNEDEIETDEYQHVKEPKKKDKITLDSATEEQSKQIQHLEDEDKNEEEGNDEVENDEQELESDEDDDMNSEELENVTSEKLDKKSEKPSKSEKSKEKCETTEQTEIEGEAVDTETVSRGTETTAHCIKDILFDQTVSTEPSDAENLELRKMYQSEVLQQKFINPNSDDYEIWYSITNKMLPNARELCEQLRLILEPTKCTRLKGDYRTGRRINMKKIIPYIASQFRKDKIWLRRTKPAQRDYKITIAIDDSKSMHHNNSKTLTLEAISLVSQALTLLESGKLSILSFGECPKIILNHTEQFDGPKLVNSLNFSQNQSRIAELLDFIRTGNAEEGLSSTNSLFENLLLILSDGRNIFSEGEQKVKNSIKLAKLQRIFLVYIIIDNPENKHSILDIRVPHFSADKKSITMKSYLDTFPFPYYVIVRDLSQLPIVLSEAMRQWFELVNSEQ